MRDAVIEKFSALITVAFGFVAALAWNNAIQSIFAKFFGTASQWWALLSYAAVVTIIAVLATAWISKVAEKAKAQESAPPQV